MFAQRMQTAGCRELSKHLLELFLFKTPFLKLQNDY